MSIKQAWNGLVLHNILLEKSLHTKKVHQDLVHSSVEQEISRLTAMLENKSDPMAYTLAHEHDEILLFELLKKVTFHEPSIHVLLYSVIGLIFSVDSAGINRLK